MRLTVAAGAATGAVAVALYPLFSGGAWFWSSLGVILVVTGTGLLAGRHALPDWLVAPLQLLTVLIFLTAVFARDEAWAVLVPTVSSVRVLGRLLATGFTDIQRYAAPVPASPGIVLLTCGGVGLIAIVVDLLAVRMRRAALAGLPLLTLFTVPAAVIADPINWLAFIIAATGYLGLLAADGRERISHWGRAVLVRRAPSFVAPRPSDAETGTLRMSGKRIGFAAVALAVLVPALLPTLEPDPLFGFGVGNGRGRGGNSISVSNPMVSMRGLLSLPENSTVLSYTSSDGLSRYLRTYALDVFDGEQWTMSEPHGRPEDRTSEGPLPAPPGLAPATPVTRATTSITVSEDVSGMSFLPLPYPAGRVDAEGDWRPDRDTLMVFSTSDTAAGLTYRVTSAEPIPTAEALKAAGTPPDSVGERYLRLPPDLPREVRALARRVTEDDASPYEKAIQLQEFFTKKGGFTYSLATRGHTGSALADFLLRSRTGYCEQFAASMAVLARILGIPARVAVGYTGGTNVSGVWQVRAHDSHAWPELYFEGTGWLRFEPTPAGSAGQGTASVPVYTRPQVTTDGSDRPDSAPETDSGGADTPRDPSARSRDDRTLQRDLTGVPVAVDEGTPVAAWAGLGLLAVLLVALVPAALRWELRARRRRSFSRGPGRRPGEPGGPSATAPAEAAEARTGRGAAEGAVPAAWAELDDVLCDYGMRRLPSESPRALAGRLAGQHGFDADEAAALSRITALVERMMFARTPGETGPLREDLRLVRRALAARATRGRRIRAVLMPPSTLLRIRRAGGRLLEAAERLESARLRLTARLDGLTGGRLTGRA
ncbi:transglutaminaseTgpA domain-containing protein [Streptosporangium sp. NPDC004379]|uniref:transglutaminase family protein n=1 Tax=Streptosporangium sp. NPDC004379 TaxID=3366189 RepID=UPI003683ECAB